MNIFLDALSAFPTISVGTQAMILGAMEIVQRRYPSAEFVFLSPLPEVEEYYLKSAGFRYRVVSRAPSRWGVAFQFRRILREVDAVVSVWGDGYTSGSPANIARKMLFLWKHGMPRVLFTASIGKATGFTSLQLARWGLRQFDQITLREPETERNLREMGVRSGRVVADTAFALLPAEKSRVQQLLEDEGVPPKIACIGLGTSSLLARMGTVGGMPYVDMMADVAKYLQDISGAAVLLIPHQVWPDCIPKHLRPAWSLGGDDRDVSADIMDRSHGAAGLYSLQRDHQAAEFKGIIKECEIFIGGRMHAVVGAISTGVPPLVMKYSHKSQGLMSMVGLPDLVWDISDSIPSLRRKLSELWTRRATVRAHLEQLHPKLIADAFSAGDALQQALARKRE